MSELAVQHRQRYRPRQQSDPGRRKYSIHPASDRIGGRRKTRREEGRVRKIAPKGPPDGKVVQIDGPRQLSTGEKAVLERLQERRQELEARARELEISGKISSRLQSSG